MISQCSLSTSERSNFFRKLRTLTCEEETELGLTIICVAVVVAIH